MSANGASCTPPNMALEEREQAARARPDAGNAATAAAASMPRGTYAEADDHLVAATTGAAAIAAGEAVLRRGGNAMDAALTVALDQIVSSGGAWNSLAGIGGRKANQSDPAVASLRKVT